MLLMLPFYNNQNLISCSDWSNVFMLTDSRCCRQNCALIMFLHFGKRFLKTRISSKPYKFLCETFRLSLNSKKSKKYPYDLLQKEKEAFKIRGFFLILSSGKLRSHLQSD